MEEMIAKFLVDRGLTIATVESCTGGLLSSKLTDVSGSSKFVHLNLVTYSNEAKCRMLGVNEKTLAKFGAVSEECSFEMAKGLNQLTNADICVSTTGIAGPTGGTSEKPVGLMYSTIFSKTKHKTYKINLSPNIQRIEMKKQFTDSVLNNIYNFLKSTFLIFALCLLFTNQVNASVETGFDSYMSNIRDKIQKTWQPPDIMEEGHASVIFQLDRDGNIISSRIKESSGNVYYDESAISALENCSPFDQFPLNTTKQTITVVYNFDTSIVKTDHVKELVKIAESYYGVDNRMALKLIDEAINEMDGDCASYFLYARRYKLNSALGNTETAKKDIEECKRLKQIYNEKRIAVCKRQIQTESTPLAYFSLAQAYDIAEDYTNAIDAINKAICMTELNNNYKRYKNEIIARQQADTYIAKK